jgi:putative transposase
LTTRLNQKRHGCSDTFFIDEVFVKIKVKQYYLWRAVDQDGEVVDVFLQAKRDGAAAKLFFKRLLRNHGGGSSRPGRLGNFWVGTWYLPATIGVSG